MTESAIPPEQLDALAATHTAIAYDRRGCGQTQAEAEAFSAVADLMAVLGATTDGTPAILVGCSGGGRIALDAALLHPAAVRALVLIAPSVSGAPVPAYPPEAAALAPYREAGIDRVLLEVPDLDRDGILRRLDALAPLARG